MVLAIGILVDDAIVVIENVERIMVEEKLSPYEATVKAMSQITSAIIGITLVLMAVFIPMAFFPGSTGQIYRQFSVTLIVSIGFSALLALTLTPALCATFLKPHTEVKEREGRFARVTGGFFDRFNAWFSRSTDRYQGAVGKVLSRPLRWLAVFVLLFGLTAIMFTRLPGGFLPTEDQGSIITVIQAPAGATRERTEEAIVQVKAFYASQPQVQNVFVVRGFSFFGQGQGNAIIFVNLKPWAERKGVENKADAIVGRPWAPSCRSSRRWCSRSIRPRFRNSAQPAVSRSSCRIAVVTGTRRLLPRRGSFWVWPRRARCCRAYGLMDNPKRPSFACSSIASRRARSGFRSAM